MKHAITGHLRGRSESIKSRSSQDEFRDNADDETVVEPDQNNVLSHIISQLRPGADLSRITLPTFILEERSMLERITNFMAHPEMLLQLPTIDDPVERFVAVVKFYLSGWHIKPPGVKKPLNPILGETFTAYWDYPDNTKGYYISEQTSHHPPKSSYFFMAPEHHIRVDGTLRPRSKFLGNSAASMMEGISYLRFTNRGKSHGGEKYTLTQPNMYARGILFGKMKYELGDHSYIKCVENGLSADIEFKTKGWVSGGYNEIGGVIKNDKTGEKLYELSGLWSAEMYIKDLRSGQKTLFFDARRAKHTPPTARPINEQGERESQRLWQAVCKAVHVTDHQTATEEKAKIEDRQRQEAQLRQEQGIEWKPKLFRKIDAQHPGLTSNEEDLEFILNTDIDMKAPPQAIVEQILSIVPILPGQTHPASRAEQQPVPKQAQPQAVSQVTPPVASQVAPQVASQGAPQQHLIDMDPHPAPTTTQNPPSIAGNPLHPTSNPKQPPSSLMDNDHHLNDKMAQMSMQQPLHPADPAVTEVPGYQKPLTRTDTETSDVDVFVDAES